MASDRFKHIRMGQNLEDKYKVPLTFNQSIGFKVEEPRNKDLIKMDRHPIVLCAETKYADEMIKTGFPMWLILIQKILSTQFDKNVLIKNKFKN